jgi:glycosyltransferase involved in cell wall biosynthesis
MGGKEVRHELGLENRVVVGFVGTFGPWHGAPILAEAARLVSPKSNCHFLFIGDGDERAETESIIGTEESRVEATFVGRIPSHQIPACLAACDILVSPHVLPADGTEFFGSPTKLFEYMSAAKPVIASRIGQIAELIRDHENGLLVEPGDPESLARAIEILSGDESLRERLGASARQTVIASYTWGHNARRVFTEMSSWIAVAIS